MAKHNLFSHLRQETIRSITPYDKSDIVRYIVYVETDYDTDGDGKPDLVKTFVQVPKLLSMGTIKLRPFLKLVPYVTGTTEERTLEGIGLKEGGNFDMAKLYEKPAKRQATKTVTTEGSGQGDQSKGLVLCQSA